MSNRIDLHTKLTSLLELSNVYFQPPNSIKMTYPCIIYELSNISDQHANNDNYKRYKQYRLTLIDKNPDSNFITKMADLPLCRFDRWFAKDNLNHYVFTLYH